MKLRELLQQMTNTQQKIGSSEPFICGGTPRDRYLKHLENISDLDITTGDKTVDKLSEEFAEDLSLKYNVIRRTMDDGHSSIYIGSFKMDFSSNFNVPNVDALLLKQGISNPTEMQKEMYSRDFTCNALLLSLDLKNLVDPTHHGFKDIKEKMIRTCLDPEITLTTNRNRVVRAIYLASKLDFNIDPKIVEYVKKYPKSVKISTEKAMSEKLNEAFNRDGDKAAYYVTKMGIWNEIPITEVVRPYYLKMVSSPTKVAYFQGGGGVNEPTPKEKKYKSDPAIVMQTRFKEPFYRNYDLYDIPGFEHIGPGAGWHSMQKYKSVSEFLEAKRKKMKDKYKADDSWILDSGKHTKENPGMKARASLLSKIIKTANKECSDSDIEYTDRRDAYICGKCFHMTQNCAAEPKPTSKELHSGKNYNTQYIDYRNKTDNNAIDFALDEYISPELAAPSGGYEENDNPVGSANQTGGMLDEYLPENDFEEKPPTALDFGRDYVGDKKVPKLEHIENLLNKYLSHGLLGLPDGVDMPDEDEKGPSENPFYGTLGPDSLMYEDKWNI